MHEGDRTFGHSRPAKLPALRPRRCNPRLHPLANQIALKLSNRRKYGRHQLTLRRVQVKADAGQRDKADPPAVQILQRPQQIDRAAAPSARLRHQYRRNFSRLSRRHNFFALRAIGSRTASSLPENFDNFVPGAICKLSQISLLPIAVLIVRRNPTVDNCAYQKTLQSRVAKTLLKSRLIFNKLLYHLKSAFWYVETKRFYNFI